MRIELLLLAIARGFVHDHLRDTPTSLFAQDARGAALLLEDVTVYRGPAEILRDINWRVEPRTKWALVGANGAGKSTLLKAIVDEIDFDGNIAIGSKESVGYLKQTAVAGSNATVYEEASSGMVDLKRAKDAMEAASLAGDLDALEKATARFESLGGHKQESHVANVLHGLGFSDFEKSCDELSGGWQMRVAFAKLLLSEPSLCLMDEPSNHLDAAAKKWLAQYLRNYRGDGSMVLVTHDVELLQSMDHIAEVVAGMRTLQIYKSCTYDQYLHLKDERSAAALAEYERNKEKAAKLQGFVDRFGASATKASAAQSRVKQLEKMKAQGLLDDPSQEIIIERFTPKMELPVSPRAVGDVLIGLNEASVGFDEKALVSGINLDVCKGMKLLIRGKNGAGKSTVLKSLRGTLPLLEGKRTCNSDTRIGMFTQDLAQELNPNTRALDIVTEYARTGADGDIHVSDESARSVLGGLGLVGDKALRLLGDLSGGERARVALGMFALKSSNVYLLDEASNHLDVECVQMLSDALDKWDCQQGAIVVVSHDRGFCSNIEFTHVATVEEGSLRLEQRNARESDWILEGMSTNSNVPISGDNVSEGGMKQDIDPELRKAAFNAPKRITKLEKMIEEKEAIVARLEQEMLDNGNDVGKLVDLSKEKEAIEDDIMSYMNEWERLEEILSLTTV